MGEEQRGIKIRKEDRFPSGWLLRAVEKQLELLSDDKSEPIFNGSFSEKPTAAGGGVHVCGVRLRNVCSPREAKGLACGGQGRLASRISSSTNDGWPWAAQFAYRAYSFPTRPRAPSSLNGEQGAQWLGT